MGEVTGIEWTDHTFNPWIGCTKVSAACDNCYAEALMDTRWGKVKWGAGQPRVRTNAANWRQPIKWNKKAGEAGVRRRVFCASLADVFDAEVTDEWRIDLMQLIARTPNLDWLLLTKRPQVAKKYLSKSGVLDNIWLGTTVEDQKMADLRIPILLSIPAKVRFLSCEPLLGPVDLSRYLPCSLCKDRGWWVERPFAEVNRGLQTCGRCIAAARAEGLHIEGDQYAKKKGSLHWIIAGGESGPKARPSHPDWFRQLRDQCQAAGVPYFHKQNGEYIEIDGPRCRTIRQDHHPSDSWLLNDGTLVPRDRQSNGKYSPYGTSVVRRVGKKAAGATLDGREHREFPT